MIDAFKSYLEKWKLCNTQQEIMLAVSGGVDSVVMTDLFWRSGYQCKILHCNFDLRGEESEADEAFVRSMGAKYEIPVFVKKFDTESYAEENGVSIQMAARDLRYQWFDEISRDQGSDCIATAHNMNDSVETALLNLARGTGIKGITGIPVRNGNYIRPLLFAQRSDIIDYCRNNHIQYREDSSNASKKYKRNKIRHDVIPVLEEINPSFIQTMNDNMQRFKESHEIYRENVDRKRELLFIDKESHIEVDPDSLKNLHPISSWLYELFSDYGFTMDQCLNIGKTLYSESGKQFISPTYRLYKDRNKLMLFRAVESSFERYYIDSPESNAALPFSMDMEVLTHDKMDEIPRSSSIASLDLNLLNFPLIIRKWQHGDYFFPLGMDQMKKVSDFFIDCKIPVPVKNRTWILTSGKDIVWIMGQRIDNRFKITSETKNILKLHLYED